MYGSTKQPEITFGEDVTEFYAACEKALPGAYEINLAMLLLHKAFNKQALEWFWELPDGFQVNAPVFVTEFVSMEATILEMPCEMTIGFRRNKPNKTNKSMSANLAHSIDSFVMREMIRLATCDRAWLDDVIEQAGTKEGTCQRMGYLSLVHAQDAGIQDLDGLLEIQCLLSTMEPFQIIPIHDSCGVKEKYIEDVQRLYRFVIGKLVASSYPEYLKDAFGVTWSDGDLKEQDVLESRFALCEE